MAPEIIQLINDPSIFYSFVHSMHEGEENARSPLILVVRNFLSNHKAQNYTEVVNIILINFRDLGCMSIKVHYLHNHLDRFQDYLSDMSEEQEE